LTYKSPKYQEPKNPVGNVAELFAGVGGFRIGLAAAGWKTTFSNQWEPSTKAQHASDVYVANFGEDGHTNLDIATVESLPKKIDLLVGGFPCQSFSIAGKRGGFNDTRGTLFFEIARIIAVKKPKAILLENVKGLLSHDNGRTFETIIKALDELGYDVEWCVFNGTDFGKPQNRPRVYIRGFIRGGQGQIKSGERIEQETPILLECKTGFRNTAFEWDKIGRVSTGVIRDYAGISIGLDGRITQNGEEIVAGKRTNT
jgi:DNA (cytosine-5)-methyltransferase 1